MRSRVLSQPAFLAGALAAVASLILMSVLRHPLILPDEAGYILAGRHIAGQGGPSQLNYFPGYSFLLAPAFLVTHELDPIYQWARLVNATLAIATAVLATRAVRLLWPTATDRQIFLTTVPVVLYPAYRLFGMLALSENLFIPLGLALGLAFARLSPRSNPAFVSGLGFAAGFVVLVHPRAIALSLGCALAGAFTLRANRRHAILLVAATAGGLVLGFAAANLVLRSPAGTFSASESDRTAGIGLITDNLSPRAIATLPFTIAGQLLYLTTATLGLFVLGIDRALRSALGVESSDQRQAFARFALATLLFTAAISALFMNQGTGDKAVYGRYLEAVLAPFLLWGAIALFETIGTTTRRWAVLLPAAIGPVLLLVRGPDAFIGRRQLLNIAGIEPIVRFEGIHLPYVTAAGIIGAALVIFMSRRQSMSTVAFIAVVYVVTIGFVVDRSHRALETLEARQALLDELDNEILPAMGDAIDCVGLDEADATSFWDQQNYRISLMDYDLHVWDSTTDAEPCSPLVISSRSDLGDARPGALLLEASQQRGQLLWILPSEQQALLTATIPAVEDPRTPITTPDPSIIHRFEMDPDPDPEVRLDRGVPVVLVVENVSDQAWVPSLALTDGLGGFAFGLEWVVVGSTDRLHEPSRIVLDEIVFPGETVELRGFLPYNRMDLPGLTEGQWDIHIEPVQEGYRWFGPATGKQLTVEVPALDEDFRATSPDAGS